MFERDTARKVLCFEALLLLLLLADAASGQTENAAEETRVSVLGRIDPNLIRAINGAVRQASRKLAEPACQSVFSDFKDADGRTLRENLEARRQDGASYVKWLIFVNGSEDQYCLRSRLAAGTNPGDRVVRVCGQFNYIQTTDPGYAAVLIIHEELHSLGLGENPPSSAEITQRVVERCGR